MQSSSSVYLPWKHRGLYGRCFQLRQLLPPLDDELIRALSAPGLVTQGRHTRWRPTGLADRLASPPPWGWSRGSSRRHAPRGGAFQRASRLARSTFSWSTLPTWPTVARHPGEPGASRSMASNRGVVAPLAISWIAAPALRPICAPLPMCSSTASPGCPRGCCAVAGSCRAEYRHPHRHDLVAHLQLERCQDIGLLAIRVVEQGDARRTVWIVSIAATGRAHHPAVA